MPEESAELLFAGSCPAPRLSPAGCGSPVPPWGTAVPGCVPQDSTGHCSGRIHAVKFLRVHFQVLLKSLCKQRLTCKFAAPHWSPCAAAGADLELLRHCHCRASLCLPPHLCGTKPSLPTGFGAASPVPAAWALPFPLHIPGEQQPHCPALLEQGSSRGKDGSDHLPPRSTGRSFLAHRVPQVPGPRLEIWPSPSSA